MIAPNTKIYVLKGIPVDKSYNHTIYWDSAEAQTTYFMSKAKVTFNDTTYQRAGLGVIRVGVNADTLYDCNYLMFQNTNYSGKWFYAFIDEVEYVNDNCCNIHYTIDEMQTWFFNHLMTRCMVEREHSETDRLGDNIVPEQIDFGEYETSYVIRTEYFREYDLVILTTDREATDFSTDHFMSGIFTGVKVLTFNLENQLGVNSAFEYLEGLSDNDQQDSILGIYMFPHAFVNYRKDPRTVTFQIPPSLREIGGYVPRNKKLLTFPYNTLYVHNGNGDGVSLRYEFFEQVKNATDPQDEQIRLTFVLKSCFGSSTQIILSPDSYKGLPEGFQNFENTLSISNFPQCAYNIDAFKVWWSQHSIEIGWQTNRWLITGIGDMIGATARMDLGGLASAGLNTVLGVYDQQNKIAQAQQMGNRSGGSQIGDVSVAYREQDFYFATKHITEEYARIIDGYFDRYGYATNELKIPNRNSRPHWNYVKTIDCLLYGEMPSESIEKLQNIYNKGITFWKNPIEIGHYELDNRPV